MTDAKSYTLETLAELLEVELIGEKDCSIDGLATLSNAGPGKLSFLSNPAYISQLDGCQASAVIIAPKFIESCKTNKLVSNAPYVTYAKASQLFDTQAAATPGIAESAIIDETASLAADVSVGANAVIEANATIESGCIIGPGSVIGARVSLGKNSRLMSNVTLYHDVVIGKNVLIHSGTVIGAAGFGFAFDGEKSVKIAQLGSVVIGNDVDIGAGTTIDRGALENTIIEQGVKIDNQVQIGHNCRVGAHTIICGCAAIAGSVTIGKYCVLGGGSGAVGHISIADKVQVSAMTLVSQTIPESGIYSSGTGHMPTPLWKKNIVRFKELNDLARRLNRLEKKLSE